MPEPKIVSPAIANAVQLLLDSTGLKFDDLLHLYRESKRCDIPRRWLSMNEAMAFAKVSRWTLMRWAVAGKIKIVKLAAAKSGKVLIDRDSLEKFLDSCNETLLKGE